MRSWHADAMREFVAPATYCDVADTVVLAKGHDVEIYQLIGAIFVSLLAGLR